MSGMSTHHPIALIEASRGGVDIETYKNELDCVLSLINNGRLGKGIDPKACGWSSAAHAAAVHHVIEYAQSVAKAIADQHAEDTRAESGARPVADGDPA